MERTTTLYYHPDVFYRMTDLSTKERKIQENMNKNFEIMIEKKMKAQKEKPECYTNTESEKTKKFIDFLTDKKNNFTSEEIRDHVKATTFAVSYLDLR